ncbi:DUF2512 family protein [Desulfosporosinus sp.]|uniref:DUF2512 family protein n=1 Tax=Desulfosporosinus sp. TaxID=157907 RepID=UPI0025BE3F6D|nr:DUF2512 family protein [Desulfosporosinus sp.]MBC2722776.1 DUF2512 family protein [Desulfosporosinus sp.]MBC2725674.1 DUF2512 family protein [Desulfosporosinus sp.]
MRHLSALLAKLVMVTLVLYVILGLFSGLSFTSVLFLSSILVIGSYLIGDLLILPSTGNLVATLADFVLVFALVWGLGRYYYGPVISWYMPALYSSFLVAGGEWFFHKYLLGRVIHSERVSIPPILPKE